MLLVSHDRAFLNNVVGRILEIEGGRLQSFKGNYDKYLQQKEVQTASMEAAYAAQQNHIARTEAISGVSRQASKARWQEEGSRSLTDSSDWRRPQIPKSLNCLCHRHRNVQRGF